jgi:hypothetical protein
VFTLITVEGTVFIPQHKTFFLIAKGTLLKLPPLTGSRLGFRTHCETVKEPAGVDYTGLAQNEW